MKKRICKFKGCFKIHHCHGYCIAHYANSYNSGHPLGKFRGNAQKLKEFRKALGYRTGKANRKFFDCKIKGCSRKHYANKLCHNHYERKLRTGDVYGILKECKAKNCDKRTQMVYCVRHKHRFDKNLTLDLSVNCVKLRVGSKNHAWKGGVSQYPNHSLMKRQRLIILMNNPKCEYCRNPATEIHHKDESKSNHELSNLAACCRKCNSRLSSKFFKLYGMTLREMAEKFGRSTCYWRDHPDRRPLKRLINS